MMRSVLVLMVCSLRSQGSGRTGRARTMVIWGRSRGGHRALAKPFGAHAVGEGSRLGGLLSGRRPSGSPTGGSAIYRAGFSKAVAARTAGNGVSGSEAIPGESPEDEKAVGVAVYLPVPRPGCDLAPTQALQHAVC